MITGKLIPSYDKNKIKNLINKGKQKCKHFDIHPIAVIGKKKNILLYAIHMSWSAFSLWDKLFTIDMYKSYYCY